MDFILDLIKKMLEGKMDCPDEKITNINLGQDAEESILTFYTEKDGHITVTVFSKEQWDMVNDICALNGEDQETVVRSLASEMATSFSFDPKDI